MPSTAPASRSEITTADTGESLVYIQGTVRFEHRKLSSGGAVYTHYLQAGGQTVGLYESTAITGGTPGAAGFKYLHRDHLGSVDTVTHFDSTLYATAVLARYSYDLWGKRRNADWTDASAPIVANETLRGYTGHEMLDTVGLVHMNGRVYDAELGRMLSADPFVPEAVNPQAFNRYSYVLNNPLSYTDPSGFFFKKLFKAVVKVFKKVFEFIASIPIIRKIAPFVVASFCGPAAACAAAVAGGLEAASGGSIFDIMTAAYSAASGVHSDFGLQDAIRAEFTGLDGGGGDGESVKEKVSRVSAGATTWVLGAFKSANGAVTGAFEFAVGLIPFVNATRELLEGNLRGALIEAGIDVAIIGVGAVTFGVGAVALKGFRGARVATRGARVANEGGVVREFVTETDQVFFRVFSEGRTGGFVTAVRPRSSALAQEALALPRSNRAEFIQEVLVPSGTRLRRSRAAPLRADDIFPNRRGGAEQFELLDRIPRDNFGSGVPFK